MQEYAICKSLETISLVIYTLTELIVLLCQAKGPTNQTQPEVAIDLSAHQSQMEGESCCKNSTYW